MIVEIKKAKITASIITQMLRLNLEKPNSEPLGWCVWKNVSVMVYYNPETKELRQFPIWRELELKHDSVQIDEHGKREMRYYIYINLKGYTGYTGCKFTYLTKEAREQALVVMNDIKEQALNKGQFYI